MLKLNLDPTQLLTQWARAVSRRALRDRLADSHITPEDLSEWAGRPDSDVIDLLLYVAWEVPLLSRAERARRVVMRHQDFLLSFASGARQVLEKVLEQYAARGAEELDMEALRSESYTELGTVFEIAKWFGGSSPAPGGDGRAKRPCLLDHLNLQVDLSSLRNMLRNT